MAKYIGNYVDSKMTGDNWYIHFGHLHNEMPMSIVQAGWHATPVRYGYGPLIRDHFLLHFVVKGSGFVQIGNMEYPVGGNQVFAIRPHQIAYYESSKNDPWEYFYIGFEGEWAPLIMKDIGFADEETVVIRFGEAEEVLRLLKKMRGYIGDILERDTGELGIYGAAYELFEVLGRSFRKEAIVRERQECVGLSQHEYTRSLIAIIENSFSEKINIQELANRMNLNRSYMSELFSRDTGMSIKQYLTEKRMQWALVLLQEPDRSIQSIAAECGFDDPLYFSRMFSKRFGISPQNYRKQMKEETENRQ